MKIMAIDYGDARTGIAVSDPLGMMAGFTTVIHAYTPEKTVAALQELIQRESGRVLAYRLTGEEGPDHNKRFFVEVTLNGKAVGQGSGRSKKEAEQMSAKAAIELLSK